MRLFLVNTDIQAGDCLAEVLSDASGKGANAHAILRKVITTDEIKEGNNFIMLSVGATPGKEAFVLHS